MQKALMKLAKGYTAKETVNEYAEEDGKLVLKRRKVTAKHVPPDAAAAKLLVEKEGAADAMSEEELLSEHQRLKRLLDEK